MPARKTPLDTFSKTVPLKAEAGFLVDLNDTDTNCPVALVILARSMAFIFLLVFGWVSLVTRLTM